ncbi:DUF6484 domain-containing protein [Paraglaciecola arctica]|uniref:DUF6484 domain-containing protein n=1 Tax=Paraglaciecola arctica BSs20135 TaxID=493475 RepID=K6Z7J3_9ALTE|nr:DUF6484 domain-containing protein [Paraglaciecola arctica]GAC19415.1 hypothetical protein GARC_2449 [Paraglaciecola arctica BSs20135]
MSAIHSLPLEATSDLIIGQFIGLDEQQRPLITSPCHIKPVVAQAIVTIKDDPLLLSGNNVILFMGGDIPIIMGFISDTLDPEHQSSSGLLGDVLTSSLHVDGKKIILQAQNEVVLKCGKSSLSLSRNGKVTIKGTNITTRSSGANKIKGANVQVN